MSIERLGIYGGTFSPPHIGHIGAARAFADAVKPDRFLIIPTYLPPHKTVAEGVSATDRLEMSRLAFSDIPGAEVSDMEIVRGGKSYTSDTLLSLTKKNREIYLLCGTDMFLTLDLWHEAPTVFRLATIAYVRREEDAALTLAIQKKKEEYEKTYGARIIEVPCRVREISSEEIRNNLSRLSDFTTESVCTYIRERKLYL